MYFSTIVAFAALPFLVGAVPLSPVSPRAVRPVSVPLSMRSDHLNGDGSVDPEILLARLHHSTARFDQAFEAYKRNTGKPHPLALKRRASNERRFTPVSVFVPVGLDTTDRGLTWTMDIAVGNPARSFSVGIDLLTADMYLNGLGCGSCHGKNFYDISASSTAINKSMSTNATSIFSFAAATGTVIADQVNVAGNPSFNQSLIVATSIDPVYPFPNTTRDGVIGFGLGTSISGENSYFQKIVNFGEPNSGNATFGFHLTTTGDANLIFGGTDKSEIVGNLTYFDVTTPDFWGLDLTSLSINGTVVATDKKALFDSDNPFISGSLKTITDIYKNIPGSVALAGRLNGLWGVPCGSNLNVAIKFGGNNGSFLIPSFGNGVISSGFQGAGKLCLGPFAFLDTVPDSTMHYGTEFFRFFYTEFDLQNRRIGIATNIP